MHKTGFVALNDSVLSVIVCFLQQNMSPENPRLVDDPTLTPIWYNIKTYVKMSKECKMI